MSAVLGLIAGWLIGETIVFRHGRSIDAPGEDRDRGTVWLVLGLGFGAIVAAFVVAALFPSAKLPGGWALMGLGLVLLEDQPERPPLHQGGELLLQVVTELLVGLPCLPQ